MIFGNDRTQLRQTFFNAWDKHLNKQATEALDQQIIEVIALHPEYLFVFENKEKYLDKDYIPENNEANPFLHMSLHLGLREQLNTNRPEGIRQIFEKLCHKTQDPHDSEHQMFECMMEMLWQSQRDGSMPDDDVYITKLKELL